MNSEKLSATESIHLISEVIQEARVRFEENGVIYVFWGLFIALISLSQFLLLTNELYAINWYPYLAIPLGFVFTMYYYWRKKAHRTKNQISTILSKTWLALGVNKMLLGFFFAPALGENLSPIILILLAIGILVSGIALRSTILIISSVLINIAGILCFSVAWLYQPLVLSASSFIAVMLPGLYMFVKSKKANRTTSKLKSA